MHSLFVSLHYVRPSLLPRGLRPCRSGGASSAALRPACACDRAGRSGGRSLAVPFASLRAGVSTRRSGRSGPARSGPIGLRPLGGLGHHPPAPRKPCCTSCPSPELSASSSASEWWVGGIPSAPRVKRLLLRRPRGPQRAHRRRETLAPTERLHAREENGEGPGGEARSWVAAAGASGRSERGRARPERRFTRGAKQEPSTQWKKGQPGRATRPQPAGQNITGLTE